MFRFNFKYYRQILILTLVFLNSGCASLNYYSQSIQGQLEVFQKSRSINEILVDENTPHTLQDRLNTVIKLRAFSIKQLGLPDNKSYLSYADLGRDYVVWNIFAAEEFSLEPRQWCFLFVGCLHYRGYFSEQDAKDFSEELKAKGMEVYLFVDLVLKYKVLLEDVYKKNSPVALKRKEKTRLFNDMRNEYNNIKRKWGKDYYDDWVKFKLNNASMASVVSYRKYLPAFLNLYKSTGSNIKVFFNKVTLLTQCTKSKRQQILASGTTDMMCQNQEI